MYNHVFPNLVTCIFKNAILLFYVPLLVQLMEYIYDSLIPLRQLTTMKSNN